MNQVDAINAADQAESIPARAGALARWPVWVAFALVALAVLALAVSQFIIPDSLELASTPRTLGRWQACHAFPFQLDAEEGFILNQALNLAQGGTIYKTIARPPFVVGNYPPLLPWVYSLITGPRADAESLPAGRVLVEICALLAALGLAAIAALRTRRLLPGLLAFLLFFITYEVDHWSVFVRVDFPALALTVAGLGVFLLVRPRWGVMLAAALFVAAGFTRQTAILAPVACAAALALHDRRRLAWFALTYLGVGLAVFAILEWRTGGEFFRHIVTYNHNRMDWTGFARVMKNEVWFFYGWWIVALAWGITDCGLRIADSFRGRNRNRIQSESPDPENANPQSNVRAEARTPNNPQSTVLSIYLLLAGLSLLSYGKVGAAPNYVLEPLAAAALWSAVLLGRLLDRLEQTPQKWTARIAAWGFCLLLLAHAIQMDFRVHTLIMSTAPGAEDRGVGGALTRMLRDTPGEVYCEDPIYLLLAGKPVEYQPFIMAQLAREGRWDPRPMLDWLNSRRFSRFVATEDLRDGAAHDYMRYTPAMAEALCRNYSLEGVMRLPEYGKNYFVWLPKEK